jgi:hypothetical protein
MEQISLGKRGIHMMKKTMVAAVLAGCIVASSSVFASDADVLRETKDRADITQLMWNYVRALDTLNEGAYAKVFTEDGEFRTANAVEKGPEQLKKIILDVKKRRAESEAKGVKSTAMYHVITNSNIEFVDKDHARHYSYWMTMFAGAAPGESARVAAVGHGVDDVVRLKGKWLIQKRDVQPKD